MPAKPAQKSIRSHLVDGRTVPGGGIGALADQMPLRDVLGTPAALMPDAMGIEQVEMSLAAIHVDHVLARNDPRNAGENLLPRKACRRFDAWHGRPGDGIGHPAHRRCSGKPGLTIVGEDSHTPAAGSLGMLAFGAGGSEGMPLHLRMLKTGGVKLAGPQPDRISARDVVLEVLRCRKMRRCCGVRGGFGRIVDHCGLGPTGLSARGWHAIADMGVELGATRVASDGRTGESPRGEGREADRSASAADGACDVREEIDRSWPEPLTAKPSRPGNVVAIGEVACAGNRRYGRKACNGRNGRNGTRQAPKRGRNALRTLPRAGPRSVPGRSGARGDSVFPRSPGTAASALAGAIADPRMPGAMHGPRREGIAEPAAPVTGAVMPVPPFAPAAAGAAAARAAT